MPNWILDASVMVKWFMDTTHEPDADLAKQLLDEECSTTTLGVYEVGNILSLKLDESTEQIVHKLELVAQVCGEPLELTKSDFLTTIRLTQEYGITFYDASYVAIAERIGRTVVSADRDLVGPGLAVDLETATRA